MAGILDAKTRIFDTILTPEGRKQLAKGTFSAKFYSFTDRSTFYKSDTIISGGLDESDRFVLEATSLLQDQITLESDDTGHIKALLISGSTAYSALNGRLFNLTGSSEATKEQVTGDAFASLSEELLDGAIDAFKKQFILRSPDPLDDKQDLQFELDQNRINFKITNDRPFKSDELSQANVKHVESFFQDARFSNVENFLFLPPVNKARTGTSERTELGHFANLNQQELTSFEDLKNGFLKKYIDFGYEQVVEFVETSTENNIIAQFFEVSEDQIKKLDVVEFVFFEEEPGNEFLGKHIFFVGKVFIDDFGNPTFLHLFTLIFES